ncbi:MAG TPA: hypothetical protein VK961_20910 [Chthoniobacter sp.]|nr:hypothetical protein [Chthoniobacter sp.]
MKMSSLFSLAVVLALTAVASGGEWMNISDAVTSSLKPGYGGPTSGIVVDRGSGDVFMVVSDLGLWRSSDHGGTFARCDGQAVGGRCETGWALQVDPAGKRLACFMIYGSSAMTVDGGATWTKFKSSHLDFGSVDWADTARCLLAIRHESGGMLTMSDDAGATWHDLQKGFNGCGVFDHATFVATKEKEPGIFRSTDGGANWTKVSAETPLAAVPVIFEGVGYWPTGSGVLVSRDKGATWTTLEAGVDATYGPWFKSATQFVVCGKSGFQETRDGGKTWQPVMPLPEAFTTKRVGPHCYWDSVGDIFYASQMGKPSFKGRAGK